MATEHTGLDAAIAELGEGERAWAVLSLDQRARLLSAVRVRVRDVAAEWAAAANRSKGLDELHPLRGEEWLTGPYAVLTALDAYAATLRRMARGRGPLDGLRIRPAPGGRVRVDALPLTWTDRLLLSGFSGEVWLHPGTTAEQARRTAGLAQRDPGRTAGVGLVLGAGNVTSIPILDVLSELLLHGRVALLKLNPTQDPLAEVFRRALEPLIRLRLVRIVTGGASEGGYLIAHPDIAHVHITGSAASFDRIVNAPGPPGGLGKPITAELGGVSPIVVVPGRWTERDLRFQAEHIATMRLQNSGHNCVAGQVVILSADWPQRDAFLDALREAYAAAPGRPVWYPNGEASLQRAREDYPGAGGPGSRLLVELGGDDDATALENTEYFAPVLGTVELPGTGRAFLDAAIEHANGHLAGTLGANVLIDPATLRSLGDEFDTTLTRLHYGTIAVNAWSAIGFMTPTLTWGAYPGSTVEDAGSGIGVVHNALLIDGAERSIVRGPFRPFPRSLSGGGASVLPRPPWFVTSRTGAETSEALTRYYASRSPADLARTLASVARS